MVFRIDSKNWYIIKAIKKGYEFYINTKEDYLRAKQEGYKVKYLCKNDFIYKNIKTKNNNIFTQDNELLLSL